MHCTHRSQESYRGWNFSPSHGSHPHSIPTKYVSPIIFRFWKLESNFLHFLQKFLCWKGLIYYQPCSWLHSILPTSKKFWIRIHKFFWDLKFNLKTFNNFYLKLCLQFNLLFYLSTTLQQLNAVHIWNSVWESFNPQQFASSYIWHLLSCSWIYSVPGSHLAVLCPRRRF